MKNRYKTFAACLLAFASFPLAAQIAEPLRLSVPKGHVSVIRTDKDTVNMGYNQGLSHLSLLTDQDYTVEVSSEAENMLHVKKQGGDELTFLVGYNGLPDARTGKLTLTSADGTCSHEIVVLQSGNTSANELPGDEQLQIGSAVASQFQPGEDISRSYDGNVSTLYHSPYSGTRFPVTLTYNLESPSHVDYLIYTPRQSGGMNGVFGKVNVYCATKDNPSDFQLVAQKDLGQSSAASSINLGENGIDNVSSVRIEVLDGYGNYASCAEMAFYERNHELDQLFSAYFEDPLCTRLKPEVDAEMAARIENNYVRMLVSYMLENSDYAESKYRIASFDAYEPLSALASRLKVNTYNAYENPTGIYFEEGKPLVLFVEGIGQDEVSLKIKNFGRAYEGEPQSESAYPLKNGVNIINPKNRGNGYISYYTANYQTASPVKIHFAMGTENGYFDLERGDTNEDWINLLKNAKSDIIDLRTKRIQVAYPTARFKQYCPEKGVELALLSDSTIYYERDIMGLLDEKEPKNRQFARVVWSSFMFADGIGAAANDNSLAGWMTPDNFEPWGFGHELGHVNQVRPGLKWVGCGETTNNIYSAWVEHKLGTGYHRLESEHSGVNDYSGLRGGRFNTYLEENVRKGVSWQLADGPDYHGAQYNEKVVKNQDYAGNVLSQDTTVLTRNFDHFVKLVPFWQLQLYCQEAGYSPDVFGKVIEALRHDDDSNMSNGMHQMRFMRLVCEATQMDFLDFFEKAGMLRPINAYIEDYGADWLKINESMIQELRNHVAEKGYKKPEGEINYISARNWKIYRDRLPLEGAAVGEGCSETSGRIKVMHNVWKNAVAFETYDAEGKLLRISMGGLGEDTDNGYSFTQVLWPQSSTEKAAYIMAVGWDGTRIKCYEK